MSFEGLKFNKIAGTNSNKAILILLGFPSYSTQQSDLGEALAKTLNRDVFILHYSGIFDDSTDFLFTGALAEADRLFKYLVQKGYSSITVCAHSFGGAIASILYSRYEKQISKLVLLNPAILAKTSADVEPAVDFFVLEEAKKNKKYDKVALIANSALLLGELTKSLPPNAAWNPQKVLIVLSQLDDVVPFEQLKELILSFSPIPTVVELEDDHWFKNRVALFEPITNLLKCQ